MSQQSESKAESNIEAEANSIWSSANCSIRQLVVNVNSSAAIVAAKVNPPSTIATSNCDNPSNPSCNQIGHLNNLHSIPSLNSLTESSESNKSQNSNSPQSIHYTSSSSSTIGTGATTTASIGNIGGTGTNANSNGGNYNHKPIKSAMRNNKKFHPSQCVPSGLGGGSIVMPSGGGTSNSANTNGTNSHGYGHGHLPSPPAGNGYISPQYGWYISMTPPTPPHYHATSRSTNASTVAAMQKKGMSVTSTGNNNNQHTQHQFHVSQQVPPSRPVFTRNLKGVPNNVNGWPSVPL